MPPRVVAVHRKLEHCFSKTPTASIEVVEGHGVRGDAHFGVTVKHRSRVARNPNQPNLRQVHLLHQELLDEFAERGFRVSPGAMGENITTQGLDLLALSTGTKLRLGATCILAITGLRNPCSQIDAFQSGLLAAVQARAEDGTLIRKAGIMAVVEVGGIVRAGDDIEIVHQPAPCEPLRPV